MELANIKTKLGFNTLQGENQDKETLVAVSYTHLTLPTILRV